MDDDVDKYKNSSSEVNNVTDSNVNTTDYSAISDFTDNKDDTFLIYGIIFGCVLFILIVSIFVYVLFVKKNWKKLSRSKLSRTKRYGKESCKIISKLPNKKLNASDNVLEKDNKIIVYNVSNNQPVKYIEKKYLMPVKIEDFEKYTETAFRAGALSAAFTIIKNVENKPCTYGSLPELKLKNRYVNLFPCDDNRVVLKKIPDDPYSDYINASFITGYRGIEKSYIAAQGPTLHTLIDFWRMIWQEKVEVICMIVNLVTNGKKACEQYWPITIGNKLLYGTISVNFVSEEVYSDFIYRKFLVTNEKKETRTIKQLHFTAWPAHDVPSNARTLVNFLRKLHSLVPILRTGLEPPILVHSSGGIGRTGTLIVLDMAFCRIFAEKMINVYADVASVRRERPNMISNVRQYLFIHLALVEYLNSMETCIVCDKKLSKIIQEAKKKSAYYYKRIQDAEWRPKVFDFWELSKNQTLTNKRFSFIEGSCAINGDNSFKAVININCIVKNRRYLAAQLPTPSNAVNFWKMLAEQNINFVLFLQLPSLELPVFNQFMSDSQFYVNTSQLKIIKLKNSKKIYDYYLNEDVLIVDNTKNPSLEKTVKIVIYNNWPENGSFPEAKELVKLWTAVENMHKKEETSSIALICRDGVTANGLWLSLSFLLRNMADFNECDVPYAVSAIRKYNKNFIRHQEHLKFLFDVALEWSSSNKKYN